MRLELDTPYPLPTVRVYLSERNLRSLLAKLQGNPPDSACTIEYQTRGGVTLSVTAEPDDAHYGNPERDVVGWRGPMHPDTEKALL